MSAIRQRKRQNVSARCDGDVLASVHRISHGTGLPWFSGFENPKCLSSLRIDRGKPAPRFAVEYKAARRRKDSGVVRFLRSHLRDLPDGGASRDIERAQILRPGIIRIAVALVPSVL